MQRTELRTRVRRACTTSLAATMVAGAVGLVAVTSAPSASAADVPLDKDFMYRCEVVAGGLNIGTYGISINAKVSVPASVAPGDTVPPRKTQITLSMPEQLRDATVKMLKGDAASGFSKNATVDLTINGKVQRLPIANLASPKLDVPQQAGEPWIIPTEGDVPAIDVPDNATGVIDMAMPKAFDVTATVYRSPDLGDLPATMDCIGPKNRKLGSIAVEKTVDESYQYTCHVIAGDPDNPLDLGDKTVGVRSQFMVPSAVNAGTPIGEREAQLTLTLPEDLRAATTDLLKGVTAGGTSDDAAIGVTIGDETKQVPIEGLSAPQTAIPATVDEPWLVPTTGQVPAIGVPKSATGKAAITMPDGFSVQATVMTAEDQSIPVSMDCVLPDGADASLTSVRIIKAPTPPAKTRTSASAPKVAYGQLAKVKVKVSPKAAGKVRVFKGKRALGTAKLNKSSRATVALGKKKLMPGQHKLQVRYLGNAKFKPSKQTTKLRVTKAKAKVNANLTTKKVVAKKTHARVRVTVKSPALKPGGKVRALVGKKVVGKAMVRKGRAVLKLKPFAKAGVKKVKIRYAGTKVVKTGSDRIKIRVVKRR
ncbi:DUF6801 domain-containing protein [Solicola gregarius]|uniref:Ig-like domain repeat protein n=1 Tax=Solicola gregarius TaxID=2908642 RepID=A0AA46TDN2_9ACTN|nr:DUF6801 domain-containing protein [Solicola gregarius]UYM03339.1 Ig-like domain repeat protein [Solicola gregarius]